MRRRRNHPAIWMARPPGGNQRSSAQSAGRVLTTSDVVAIRIVDHPELDTTTRIEPDGTINFPYVGRIKAAGRTEDDLARAVGRRLIELKIHCRALIREADRAPQTKMRKSRPSSQIDYMFNKH